LKIIKYTTNEDIDFSEELEKVWWDFLGDGYEVSMVNTDVLDDPISRNAYSYQIKDGKVYYSIISDTQLKYDLHCAYEDIINKKVYLFDIIDKYTYSVKHYETATPSFEVADEILSQISQFTKLKPFKEVGIDVLDDWIYRLLTYIDINKIYEADVRDKLHAFYTNNRKRILKLQSFGQGNCSFDRVLTDGEICFFDYFSIYEKEAYSSGLLDKAQFLVDVMTLKESKLSIFKYLNSQLDDDKDVVLFFALLQEEAMESENAQGYFITSFKNI